MSQLLIEKKCIWNRYLLSNPDQFSLFFYLMVRIKKITVRFQMKEKMENVYLMSQLIPYVKAHQNIFLTSFPWSRDLLFFSFMWALILFPYVLTLMKEKREIKCGIVNGHNPFLFIRHVRSPFLFYNMSGHGWKRNRMTVNLMDAWKILGSDLQVHQEREKARSIVLQERSQMLSLTLLMAEPRNPSMSQESITAWA